MEEEVEQKEGEEEKAEVIKIEFWIVGLVVPFFLIDINSVVNSDLLNFFPGWEENKENNKNWKVLGLGISQWNKANMGELFVCLCSLHSWDIVSIIKLFLKVQRQPNHLLWIIGSFLLPRLFVNSTGISRYEYFACVFLFCCRCGVLRKFRKKSTLNSTRKHSTISWIQLDTLISQPR